MSVALASGVLPLAKVEPVSASVVGSASLRRAWRLPLLIFLYSALLGLGSLALDGRIGLNLADEGYLQYGVSAIVERGEVPIRDFQSYDPGRYYWAAAWSPLFGKGVVSTRAACALFQVLAVGMALLALRRAGVSLWMLGVAGLLCSLWMVPRFKSFEQGTALLALYPAVCLIQNPGRRTALLAGVFVGLAACIGRNHGFYNGLAFGALIVLLAWKERRFAALHLMWPWMAGIFLGYLPMLLMMALVPGFFGAFVESVATLARNKSTNPGLPIPWPWTVHLPETAAALESCFIHGMSWCFVALAGGYAFAALVIGRLSGGEWRQHAALVAAVVVGLPYAHYAFSRADPPHLGHSMPLLVLTLLLLPPAALPQAGERRTASVAAAFGLCALTLAGSLGYNPVLARNIAGEARHAQARVGSQVLRVDVETAALLGSLRDFVHAKVAPGEKLLILPYAPMLYEAVGRPAPVPDIYLLWPKLPEGQRAMIRALEAQRVDWTILDSAGVDRSSELCLQNTYPLLLHYLRQNFEQDNTVRLPGGYFLLHRRQASFHP